MRVYKFYRGILVKKQLKIHFKITLHEKELDIFQCNFFVNKKKVVGLVSIW